MDCANIDTYLLLCFRYALKDLWESEREYISDLEFCVKNYHTSFEAGVGLPKELEGKKDIVFGEYPNIYKFHDECVLLCLLLDFRDTKDNLLLYHDCCLMLFYIFLCFDLLVNSWMS